MSTSNAMASAGDFLIHSFAVHVNGSNVIAIVKSNSLFVSQLPFFKPCTINHMQASVAAANRPQFVFPSAKISFVTLHTDDKVNVFLFNPSLKKVSFDFNAD